MDIVTTSNFHATLLRGASPARLTEPNNQITDLYDRPTDWPTDAGQVSVVFLPAEFVRQSSWPLLKCVLLMLMTTMLVEAR